MKTELKPVITFAEALIKLNIVDFEERIFKSNSHGELVHLTDYIWLANNLPEHLVFRAWFVKAVLWAEQNWERPESIFQHILTCMRHGVDKK
jgi:hypothetical protein